MLPVWAGQNVPHMMPSGDPVSAFELRVLLGLVLADRRKDWAETSWSRSRRDPRTPGAPSHELATLISQEIDEP